MRRIVKEEYEKTRALMEENKDKIIALGDRLLEKETLNLPDIMEILGKRPFGMNETMTKYLEELQEREKQAESMKADESDAESDQEEEAEEEKKQ